MKNKVIIFSIALAGIATSSICNPVSFTVPGKPARTVNLTAESDAVEVDTLQEIITEKNRHGLPLIMAAVPAGNVYHYFNASTMLDLYKHDPTHMTNPNNRQPLTDVYFFVIAKPTDTQATYLCSNKEILTTDRNKLALYQPIFDAYTKDNNAGFTAAMGKIPKAPQVGEKRLGFPSTHGTEYHFVKITDRDPVSGQQIQVLMNQKTAKGVPYIVAVAVTLDKTGNFRLTLYDPTTLQTLYNQAPGYGKGSTGGYNIVNKPDGIHIHEIYYYTLNSLSDPELHYLCSGQEILTGYTPNASLYKAVLTASQNGDRTAYNTAYARLPRH